MKNIITIPVKPIKMNSKFMCVCCLSEIPGDFCEFCVPVFEKELIITESNQYIPKVLSEIIVRYATPLTKMIVPDIRGYWYDEDFHRIHSGEMDEVYFGDDYMKELKKYMRYQRYAKIPNIIFYHKRKKYELCGFQNEWSFESDYWKTKDYNWNLYLFDENNSKIFCHLDFLDTNKIEETEIKWT